MTKQKKLNFEELRKQAEEVKQDLINKAKNTFKGVENWDVMQQVTKEKTGADDVGFCNSDHLLARFADKGCLAELYIGRPRFKTKLQPQDLGLDPNNPEHKNFVENHLHLGSKLLIPAKTLKELDRIDNKLRQLIKETYGIPTALGYYIPYQNWDALKAEINALKAEYFRIRDEILADYDNIKVSTAQQFREYAPEVFRLRHKDPNYQPTPEEIETFVKNTMAHFPAMEKIRNGFVVKLDVNFVQTSNELAEQRAQLEAIKQAEELYRKEIALLERKLNEDARVQEFAERQRILVEKAKAETKLMQERARQQAIKEAIEIARDQHLPKINQVFADLSGAVCGIIYDAVTKATTAIKTQGSLTSGASKSLSSMLEKVKHLLFEPNPEVEMWLKQINDIIETPSQRRNPEHVQYALDNIRAEAARVILDIGCIPRTLRNLREDIELEHLEEALKEIGSAERQVREQVSLDDIMGDIRIGSGECREVRMLA